MRIVSLEPFVTDILIACEEGGSILGFTHECTPPRNSAQSIVVTKGGDAAPKYFDPDEACFAAGVSRYALNIEAIKGLAPDRIITQIVAADAASFIAWGERYLEQAFGKKVVIQDVSCGSLERMYEVEGEVAAVVKRAREGRMMAGRAKAQLMEWADSFYSRCKGKKVVVISGLSPIQVADGWIPSLVRMFSASYFRRDSEQRDKPLTWGDVCAFAPDVMVVAPRGKALQECASLLSFLQGLPDWEAIPAVKRGEVVFCDSSNIYRAGPRFVQGAAVLVSAIAGLDSGYITQRDEYFKIRYIELYRHKFS